MVAAKAIVLNLLSVGAAYGLLVLVFQEGIGNELFGFQQVDAIEAWVPLFLFSVLFGLSMDYHVFLLSRIRERYVETGDNDGAIAYAVGSTARLITGAALIIIAVFAGFAVGDLVMFQQMGFGVAVVAPDRRDAHPLGARAGGDDAARRAQLVAAALARVAAARQRRRAAGATGPVDRPPSHLAAVRLVPPAARARPLLRSDTRGVPRSARSSELDVRRWMGWMRSRRTTPRRAPMSSARPRLARGPGVFRIVELPRDEVSATPLAPADAEVDSWPGAPASGTRGVGGGARSTSRFEAGAAPHPQRASQRVDARDSGA